MQCNCMWPCVLYSIERLFDELSESACSALDPLQVSKSGVLTVNAECRRDPKSLFMLVYVHRLVLSQLLLAIEKWILYARKLRTEYRHICKDIVKYLKHD